MPRILVMLVLLCQCLLLTSGCSREETGPGKEQIFKDFYSKHKEMKTQGGGLTLVSSRSSESTMRFVVGMAKDGGTGNENTQQWELEYVRSGSEWVLGTMKVIPGSAKSCEFELISKATNAIVRLMDYSNARVLSNVGFHRYIKNGEQKAEVILIVRKPDTLVQERIKLIFREESGVFVFNGAYLESRGDYRKIQTR